MARVHFVKKARKNYKGAGIKKGDSYYWWKPMICGRGGARRLSKTAPRPSQTTQSEYLSSLYAAQESVEDAATAYFAAFAEHGPDEAKQEAAVEAGEVEADEAIGLTAEQTAALEAARDEFADALRSAAEEIRNLGEETQSKYENMPESLQQGDTGQLLETRAQGCETLADQLEQAADDLAGKDAGELTDNSAQDAIAECDFSEADQ